jgi:prevent-host-death family protein
MMNGQSTLAIECLEMHIGSMAQRYSIAEAGSNLARVIDEVEAGREVELTRHGKPVAVVLSLREYERLRSKRSNFGAAYEAFLREHALNEIGLKRILRRQCANRSSEALPTCSPAESSTGRST